MKLAVLGGTFNPLHKGHAMIAQEACEKLGYEKVLFVPSFMPPHKMISAGLTVQNRLEMVRSFCSENGSGRFVCEPCEIERGGVSYTVDTLEYIVRKYGNEIEGKPAFILGEESAAEFHKWKNPERIVQLADLVIARRVSGEIFSSGGGNGGHMENIPTGNFTGDFSVGFNPETFGFPFIELKNPEMKISSSEIRALIAGGGEWEEYVPEAVCRYIRQKNLYRQ